MNLYSGEDPVQYMPEFRLVLEEPAVRSGNIDELEIGHPHAPMISGKGLDHVVAASAANIRRPAAIQRLAGPG